MAVLNYYCPDIIFKRKGECPCSMTTARTLSVISVFFNSPVKHNAPWPVLVLPYAAIEKETPSGAQIVKHQCIEVNESFWEGLP